MTTYTADYLTAVEDEILLELKEHKGTPLSPGELSKTLNLPIAQVSHIIKDMPYKYPICTIEDKYFVPKESILAWVTTLIIVFVIVETFARCI